jgi:hypothetical protein
VIAARVFNSADYLDNRGSRGTQSIIRDAYGEVAVTPSYILGYECLTD